MKTIYILLLALMSTCSKTDKECTFNKAPLDLSQYEFAYFADACFWCTEAIFECVRGVVEVESGYAGGTTDYATYTNHGDHAEAIKVYYNEETVNYETLVDAYFDGHSYGKSPDRGNSYRAVIFPNGTDQRNIVDERLMEEILITGGFYQQIIPFEDAKWTKAEDYHQDVVARYLANCSVTNASYVMGESVPRMQEFKENTDVPLKN